MVIWDGVRYTYPNMSGRRYIYAVRVVFKTNGAADRTSNVTDTNYAQYGTLWAGPAFSNSFCQRADDLEFIKIPYMSN